MALAATTCHSALAQEDPLQVMAEQAAVLEAAPSVSAGTLSLDEAALEGGAFVWITVEQVGLYTLATDTPGALVLGSIPTPDGRYDGTTSAQQHEASMSQTEPPGLGPLLLSPAHPYLLSVSSQTGATTLTVSLAEALPDVSPIPERGAALPEGTTLYAADANLDLVVRGADSPRRIEVIAEPRATLTARLGGETVPVGGRYPWLSEADARLTVKAKVGKLAPPARVLVRVLPTELALDEAEPNESSPNPVLVGKPFKGHLLHGDTDALAFTLDADSHLSLDVATAVAGTGFSAQLLRVSGDGSEPLWNRAAGPRGLQDERLALAAGSYRLELKRKDGKPGPLPYTVSLAAALAPGANDEVEPNDTPEAAMPMPDSLRVSGSAVADDLDRYRFSVPDDKPEHLWRVFTLDAGRIELSGDGGSIAKVSASGRRTTIDSLALVAGEYQILVRAEGDYLLRVMDLGPRPSDYEGEPNNDLANGQRLELGAGVRGGFHHQDDLDYYLFRLDAPSPVEITVRPTGDGPMDAKLYLGRHKVGTRIAFTAEDGPYAFRSTLPAGDWALVLRPLAPNLQNPYEVMVDRVATLAGNEPDDAPLDAVKLPRDGDIAGSVGAFDAGDQVFVPLPEGEGLAAMVCSFDPAARPGRWRLYHWSDDRKIADIRNGIAVFAYGPQLGGAVRFGLDATERSIDYECSLRFPPTAAPAIAPTADTGSSTPLGPGETRRVTLAADGPEPHFALDVEEGAMAFVACRDGAGTELGAKTRVWQLAGASKPTNDLLGPLTPFVAGAEPEIRLHRNYAERLEGAALPLDVECSLYGVDDLPRPGDMGPAAEFRILEQMAVSEADGNAGGAAAPSPGLEALIARAIPDRQPEGALPVNIVFDELPELAAFSEAGQSFEATAKLVNESDETLHARVVAEIDSEGWRIDPPQQHLTVEPDATVSISVQIIAPPWLSPSLKPALVIRAEVASAYAAEIAEFPISTAAVPLNPVTYWHAPDDLRGGLNLLHYGLGARLIEWGEEIPDGNKQRGEQAIHDGLAPHIDSVNAPKTIAFRLAAKGEIAGIMIQLRSTAGEERWPAEVEVLAPAADGGWQRIGAAALKTVHAPQYLVFDQPVTTDRLRFVFPRCWSSCAQVWVQEIQAIATPGSHPDALPPINAADPELGGHVVWSTERFGGSWNQEFLVGEPTASNQGWPGPGSEPVMVTVAFHHNRAARVRSVAWLADPDDSARIPEARVEASVDGPNGPWTALGRLPAPPLGELRSALELPEPAWVRYLRFTFEIPQEGAHHYGPDGIEVIEARGTSVLGLWEDDQPRAALEASIGARPPVAAPPAGGPNRDAAVALPLGKQVQSSVVMERNEDWWRIETAEGTLHGLQLQFERDLPMVVPELYDAEGVGVALEEDGGPGRLRAVLQPGSYYLRIFEPRRSVVISWDTSGSVSHYIPRTLAAVRTWGRGLKPGRDALQLLPFGPKGFLLEDWAETPEVLEPALNSLPEEQSSNSEKAMQLAAEALSDRRGSRGIVIMTDAQTGINDNLWPALLDAMPRVVSLSIDSDSRQNAAIMMDWANLNGGYFRRVIGPLGLADSMELANALFRAPKAYALTAQMEELVEPEGEGSLTIAAVGEQVASGAVELILDASGSMLQRMEGRRRIDIAHEALAGLVRDTLPEGMPFAFRAFGLEEDACRSELIVPLGPLDREAAARAIESVPAVNLARTAIADSLRAAGDDLAGSAPPRVVVLVTDGEETCDGDPESAIAELRASGLDARVNIVGFAIDDQALAETFSAWAESGGGTYFDARGAEALEQSIADALRPRFEITRTYLNGRTEVIGRVALGETVTVPAGRLAVAPASGASGDPVTLQMEPNGSADLGYSPEAGLVREASDD